MDQNRDRDWKPIAALVLAGLALFIALGGSRNDQSRAVPQQIIVQPAAPSAAAPVAPAVPAAPVITLPDSQIGSSHAWKGGWPLFACFPLLFLAGLIFLLF